METGREGDFELGKVVFFGRGLDEYVRMFDLDLEALKGQKILDCPAGPAAFAAQAPAHGFDVTACDPLFCHYDINLLREIVEMDARNVSAKQTENPQYFHAELTSVAERRTAMEIFLQDYMEGRLRGRYIFATLPELDFAEGSFDLVLSANLLFIYSDITSGGMMQSSLFDYEFHRRAVLELVRVSRGEVRIYPLRGPNRDEHVYLGPLIKDLQALNLKAEVRPVAQRDIAGAEEMLVISR